MAVDPDMDVLIVDDASAMRRIVSGLHKELGIKNIRDAGNGQLTLDELKKKKADFVVSDWNKPGITGIELLKAIRAADGLMTTWRWWLRRKPNSKTSSKRSRPGLTISSPSRLTRRRSRSSRTNYFREWNAKEGE